MKIAKHCMIQSLYSVKIAENLQNRTHKYCESEPTVDSQFDTYSSHKNKIINKNALMQTYQCYF